MDDADGPRAKWVEVDGETSLFDGAYDRWDDVSNLEAGGFNPRRLGLIIGAALVPIAGGLIVWRVLSRRR